MSINKERFILVALIAFTWMTLNAQSLNQILPTEDKTSKIKDVNPDSLLMVCQKAKIEYLETGDTLSAIDQLIEISRMHATSGNYTNSYDGYWDALILSNKISDSTLVGDIYRGLGVLYSLYGRYTEAESYFDKSLAIQREMIKKGKLEPHKLSNIFYTLTSYHRELGNYHDAQSYLDSCWSIRSRTHGPEDKAPHLEAEQGRLYYLNNQPDKAIEMLLNAEKHYKNNQQPYLVVFYSYLGDAYYEKKNYSKSESYYLKSIEVSETYRSHKNYVTKVYQKLADLYLELNKMKLAYEYQQKARELTEKLFDARSKNNSIILEIKDDYRLELEKQKQLLETARLNDLEQERKILFLKNSVLSISFAFLLIIAGIAFWYLQNKRKTERILYVNKQKMSSEKNREILDVKNKELTSSALQLIHKDELLLEIKNTLLSLKKSDNNKTLDEILNKIKINSKQDWNEFNIRFTSVNKDFYKTLSEKFPELTQRDHKLCALIKLNFTSKEISQLLGISMESVNTSRYRLRKKMQLSKTDNLTEYIARL